MTATPLDEARLESLDHLLEVLDLRQIAANRFRAEGAPGQFPRTFGGRLIAQALTAASATVADKPPSALHACFVAAGTPTDAIELDVQVAGDTRMTSTRHVDLRQGERTLLTMVASFHTDTGGAWLPSAASDGPGPTETPLLQDWIPALPEALRDQAASWIERPPPIELRVAEPPIFFGGAPAATPRSHWMRLPRDVGEDPVLHAVLLAHASDYLLLDMAFRSHPVPFGSGRLSGTSLDHSVWFHQPVRFETWHRHTQETVAIVGERGLVRGVIHDEEGQLVARTAQAVLVRVEDATSPA